jgi:hypothetical protein
MKRIDLKGALIAVAAMGTAALVWTSCAKETIEHGSTPALVQRAPTTYVFTNDTWCDSYVTVDYGYYCSSYRGSLGPQAVSCSCGGSPFTYTFTIPTGYVVIAVHLNMLGSTSDWDCASNRWSPATVDCDGCPNTLADVTGDASSGSVVCQ